ncbi:MAG: amino acid ABC transporter substrate-binding protein, partial [Anaerolineae bacterium]|nr:amino acid ABC transporter substrate-binding protein [Anaerolineae bacterium]
GPVNFDAGNQNYGPDLQKIKQIQNGEWLVVYPDEFAKAGSSVAYPSTDISAAGSSEETMEEPSGEPIKIGGSLGLTGAFAGPSAGYKVAYDYWVDRVNSEGGLLGRPVELIIYDDESTPATAQSLYQRLITEDEVDLLLSPFSTAVGGAVIPLAESNEMILWNGGFVGVELFDNSEWMFGSYTYQEPEYPLGIFELIDSLPEDQRPTTVAIATAQNPFTLGARDGYNGEGGALKFAADRGMEVVVNEEYGMGVNDVSGIIQKAKVADAELFVALATPNDASLIARTMDELDYNPKMVCYCGSQVTSLAFWPGLDPAGANAFSTVMGWPSDDYSEIGPLAETITSEFDFPEMPSYATVALSILQIMEQAVEATETLDQATLRDYLLNNEFDTANGTIRFAPNGTTDFNAAVVQFIDGKNEIVWPADRATADPVLPE